MKNKSGNTNGQHKRDSATRSAGKQATGNRNKHLLAAERRRTDEPHGRLNKQNPVSPQKVNYINKSDEPSKNAGFVMPKLDNELIPIGFKSWDDFLDVWFGKCTNLQ